MDDETVIDRVYSGLIEANKPEDFSAIHEIATGFLGTERDFTTDRKIEALRDVFGLAIQQIAKKENGLVRIGMLLSEIPARADQNPNFGRYCIAGLTFASVLFRSSNPDFASDLHKKAQDTLAITLNSEMRRMDAQKYDGGGDDPGLH